MITRDRRSEIARGQVPYVTGVNKYGRSVKGIQTTATDIWDLAIANAGANQPVWLAPTAARIHTIVSSATTDVCGIGTLTFAENAANTNTVTIGAKVYTFQTTLTNVDGNVKRGANAAASIVNLVAAINLGTGAGTTYATAMTANAVDVQALDGAGDTVTLWDHSSALIATTDTLAGASAWASATTLNGVGSGKVRIWYLPTWDTEEVYEDVYLHGTVGVLMTSAAVIIHRMKMIENGVQYNVNDGIIKATAATDSSITAAIVIGACQTQMAIYGIPSTKDAILTNISLSSKDLAKTGIPVEWSLLVNEAPDINTLVYLLKGNIGTDSSGSSNAERNYDPYKRIQGPAIIKIQAVAAANDTGGTAEFDMEIVSKS